MRKILLTNLLIASLALHSCSDGSATVVTDRVGPEAPINEPDPSIFNPSGTVAGGEETAAPGSGSESGTGSSGTEEGGEAIEEPGTGSQTGNGAGNGSNGSGSGGTGEGPNPGGEGGGGNPSSGQPVPEPGTLLLFGTGLAGIGASLLRRRRRDEEEPAAE